MVDPRTGQYSAAIRSPTGIPVDPELTAHGVDQAKELAAHLMTVDPPVEQVYSSPYYRCLQTVEPFVSLQAEQPPRIDGANPPGSAGQFKIRGEAGLGEWYGSAPFEHPTSASPEVLQGLFPAFDAAYRPAVAPPRWGESVEELHDRVAQAVNSIIEQCDRQGLRAVLLCTHAAVVIALGRVLTGHMPHSVEVEDFGAFTCGLSVYRRRPKSLSEACLAPKDGSPEQKNHSPAGDIEDFAASRRDTPSGRRQDSGSLPQSDLRAAGLDFDASHAGPGRTRGDPALGQHVDWKGGQGVGQGWDCEKDSDCSFLSRGEERGW